MWAAVRDEHRAKPDSPAALNRLELVRETMRHVLDELAQVAPGWLREHAGAEWVERYRRRSDDYRLPKTKEAKQVLADQMGQNGAELLGAIYSPDSLQLLREVPAVEMMRRIWLQNYLQTGEGVRFRTEEDGIPKAARLLALLTIRTRI